MMSQCMVPNWSLRQQRQEQVGGEEGNRSSHVNCSQLPNQSRFVPMSSNYEVAELTWENGQLAMHELGGLLPTAPTKQQTWGTMGTGDNTLESIVHQATIPQQQKQNQNIVPHQHHGRNNIPAAENNPSSTVASSAGKEAKTSGLVKKRMRLESHQSGRNNNNIIIQEEFGDRSASASATVCRDNDTTVMTWASFESPRSMKTKATDEDSACHDVESENLDEERETKEKTGRSHSTRRTRAAAIHNQSERRRRDRINQKMKALQKLVPNASKSDKASMLDEVINYLKQLQAQVQMMMMSNAKSMHMPQMMMPMGIQAQQQQQQQQIQMSMQLARMGMGVGLGSIGMGMGMGMGTGIPQSLPQLIHHPPPLVVPPMIPNHTPPQTQPTTHQDAAAAAITNSLPFNHPYYAFLAQQSMNMNLCNKMAEIYRQQVNQSTTPPTSNPSPSSHGQRG